MNIQTSPAEAGRLVIERAVARQEELLAELRAHRLAFRRRIEGLTFTRARDFCPVSPLDEWLEVGSRRGSAIDIPMLVEAGRIEVITVDGRHYAREAAA